jgi:hypothetical protein
MILSYALVSLFLFSEIDISNTMAWVVHIVFIGSVIFFCLAWLVNPGYLNQDKDIDFHSLIEKFDANHLCPEC